MYSSMRTARCSPISQACHAVRKSFLSAVLSISESWSELTSPSSWPCVQTLNSSSSPSCFFLFFQFTQLLSWVSPSEYRDAITYITPHPQTSGRRADFLLHCGAFGARLLANLGSFAGVTGRWLIWASVCLQKMFGVVKKKPHWSVSTHSDAKGRQYVSCVWCFWAYSFFLDGKVNSLSVVSKFPKCLIQFFRGWMWPQFRCESS